MSIQRFAAVVLKEIDAKADTLRAAMEYGQCASYEEYKRCVGNLQGLAYARDEITSLLDKVEQSDE